VFRTAWENLRAKMTSHRKNVKVLVMVDMEGISGIDDWHMIMYGMKEFKFGQAQATEDVNAVVRGLKAGGATEIRVVSGHGSGAGNRNIIEDKLEKGVKLFQSYAHPYRMLRDAADESVSAAVLLGFHAMAGTKDGFLRHTINIEPRIKINGRLIGEVAFNAFALGEHGIPVIMATGDQALVREATLWLAGIETVQVKTSVDSKTTKCLPPKKARKLIQEAATRALLRLGEFKPLKVKSPIEIEVSWLKKEYADRVEIFPRVRRASEKSVSYVAENWTEAADFMIAALRLASPVTHDGVWKELTKLRGFKKAFRRFNENVIAEWLSQ